MDSGVCVICIVSPGVGTDVDSGEGSIEGSGVILDDGVCVCAGVGVDVPSTSTHPISGVPVSVGSDVIIGDGVREVVVVPSISTHPRS